MAAGPDRLNGIFAVVVEGEPGLVSNVLTYYGALVRRATSAHDVASAADLVRPDVLVCDLPVADAVAFLDELRARSLVRDVPAVAVTGSAADRVAVLAGGFRGHLTKPFDPVTLCDAVAGVVDDGRAGTPFTP